MAKKPNKGKSDSSFDAEIIRQFMLGGSGCKDEDKVPAKFQAEVDLHIDDEALRGYGGLSEGEKFRLQLNHLEKQIEKALAGGLVKLDVIHGRGAGRLRDAVHAYLKQHPRVKSFRIMRDGKHAGGVTEVVFK